MATPFVAEHLAVVVSTQDEARSRWSGSPILVTATAQTGGRGRAGTKWLNADRSVACSLAFSPSWPGSALPRLTLVAGLAALDVVDSRARLKWPNDVLIGGAKVGGLLAESIDGVVVVGMGLNLFWSSPPPGIGGLFARDPGPEQAREIAVGWAGRLVDRTGAGPEDWGHDEYVDRCATIGELIEWEPGGSGLAVNVDAQGGLVVSGTDGLETIRSGAVRHLRQK